MNHLSELPPTATTPAKATAGDTSDLRTRRAPEARYGDEMEKRAPIAGGSGVVAIATVGREGRPASIPSGGAAADDAHDATVLRLPRLPFWTFLAVALAIFTFSTGPVWTHPWDIDVLDVAIYISYVPIPFMVVGYMAWRRALSLKGAFLDVLELTLLKYSITFVLALVLWIVAQEPPTTAIAPTPARAAQSPEVESVPTPSIIAPEETGVLQGTAVDGAGRPMADALIFIESGLDGYVFAPPTEPLRIENAGGGISPRIAAVQAGRPILARSTDGHLHTLVVSSGDATRINVPLLRAGSWTPVDIRGAGFITALTCSVHQRLGNEARAYLGVFAHPFFAITGADGRFRFSGVPAASLRLGGFHPERGSITREAVLARSGTIEVGMSFDER